MARAQEDEPLRAEAKDAIESSEGPDKLVALGKKNGFSFTGEEVGQVLGERNKTLSEAELDAVAGGLFVHFVKKPRLPVPSPAPPALGFNPGGRDYSKP
jgi:predicted ribosomally synthesized peptide with nif11-like leader